MRKMIINRLIENSKYQFGKRLDACGESGGKRVEMWRGQYAKREIGVRSGGGRGWA